ncbi:MAG: Ig-like domain-containing protein [Myxococcota bacterium]
MRSTFAARAAAVLAFGLWGMACGDSTPPPAPYLDPVPSPTGDLVVTLTGSAEPNARIDVSGAVAVAPAKVKADKFTSSFRLEVTLAPDASNTLAVTATDADGNTSKPTEVVVVHETGHGIPASLAIDLYVDDATTPSSDDPLTLAAGSTLRVDAVAKDAAGHALDVPLVLSTDAPDAFVVGDTISGLTHAGSFAVAAQVPGTLFGASRAIAVTPGAAARVTLEATPADAVAGQPIAIVAQAEDAFGNHLDGAALTLGSEPALDASFAPPCGAASVNQGFVTSGRFVAYDLSGGGDFTLTATSGDLSASASVTVAPGPAARFAPLDPANCAAGEAMTFTDASWTTPVVGALSVAAGESVYYRYAVIDAYGNATTGPVDVFTTAPGAQVIDDGVSGHGQIANLTAAGTFELAAYITGVAAPATRTFAVDVGDATVVNVFLSASLASRGDTVEAFATVKDRYGNLVPCPAATVDPSILELDASPSTSASHGATTCSNGLFQSAFVFDANDSYAVVATWHAGATPVSASAFVTILGLDSTPPTVGIENVRVEGVPCVPGDPPTCNVTQGDVVTFDVVASDNISLSEVEYAAFFETTQSLRTRRVLVGSDTALPATLSFTFTIPGNAQPELVPLVAMAVDGAGNRASSNEVTLNVDVFAAGGRAVTVVASGGLVNGPHDVAFDGAGNLYIANDGNNDLLRIDAGTVAPYRYSTWNTGTDHLVADAAGQLFVTASDGDVYRVATNLGIERYLSFNTGNAAGLALAGGWLFVGRSGSNSLPRFATNATPVLDETDAAATYNVGRPQQAVAVKDASSGAGFDDIYTYAIDLNQRSRLVGYHAVGTSAPTQVFSIAPANFGGGGNSSLADVALESPTGCLVVADSDTRRLYAIDVRDPTDTTPTVTEIASGFSDPRGLAFSGGNLYVVDAGYDAVIRIGPSANPNDCF